jgi:hypothetical protein
MSGPGRRFDPSELAEVDGAPLSDAEAAAILATARDLEGFAQAATGSPTPGFADRVMTAVAMEAPPRPVVKGLLVAFRDAWRITWSGDRPMAVRAQAFALVLIVLVAVGSTGTLAAVGLSRLLADEGTPPPTVAPSVDPSTSTAPSTDESEEPGGSEEPSETPEGTDESGSGSETEEPTKTPRPTARPTNTPHATDTPEPTGTEEPDDTPEPEDTPEASKTPQSTRTPEPSGTPDSEDDSSGHGSGSDGGEIPATI